MRRFTDTPALTIGAFGAIGEVRTLASGADALGNLLAEEERLEAKPG